MLITEEKATISYLTYAKGEKQLKLLYQYIEPVYLLTKRDIFPFEPSSIVF